MSGSTTSVRFPLWEAGLIVGIHYVDIEIFSRAMAVFEALLSPEEQRRSDQFGTAERREQFVVVRGVLRLLLSRRLGVNARELEFAYGPAGKPALAGEVSTALAWFNVAHSRGLGAIALCDGGPVGIDVEWVNTDAASRLGEAAARLAGVGQKTGFEREPGAADPGSLYRQWVRFEAARKWLGEGVFSESTTRARDLQMRDLAFDKTGLQFVGCVAAPAEADIEAAAWLGMDFLQ